MSDGFIIEVKSNCRYYRGDVPCTPNKLRGKECPTCDEYDPIRERLLLIKLGAPGDVLRTTSLLPKIRDRWPSCELTWLTRESARPLLENLPEIDRVLTIEEEGFIQLQGEWFDICVNLDNDPLSASMATQVRSDEVIGFRWTERGKLFATNQAAVQWLQMAMFDRLKQENSRSYQSIMREILHFDPDEKDPIQIRLTEEEEKRAENLLNQLGYHDSRPIAFNTGSGERWKTKRWPMDSFLELGMELYEKAEGKILLVGGPLEHEENQLLAMERPDLFNYAGILPVRDFMALIGKCRLLLTSDTLALHVGIGMGVPTVALFGSTSAPEIEDEAHLKKVIAPVDCICCYLKECHKEPYCMDELTPALVHEAILSSGFLEKSPDRKIMSR